MLHFLNPNYHVILIHYPLGVFMFGLTIEILGFLWKNSSVRVAARWMILLGGLATLPASTSGIYALSDAISNGTPLTKTAAHMLKMHVWLQSIATLLATFTAVFALAAADSWRRRFNWIALIVFAACGALMVVGSWYAGESVYTQGVAVRTTPEAEGAATQPIVAPKRNIPETITYFAGEPEQLHMIGAGVMFAIAMAALGLSIRKITSEYPDAIHLPLMSETSSSDTSDPYPLTGHSTHSDSPQPMFSASTDPQPEAFPVPAGRFWLVAALLAAATAGGGYWIWANQSGTWSFNSFWTDVMSTKGQLRTDRAAIHVWVGVSLIVLPLILGMLARWAPQQKSMLSIFAVLLVFAISAQVLLGVLLQFDGGSGPLYKFSPSTDKDSASLVIDQFAGVTCSRSSV